MLILLEGVNDEAVSELMSALGDGQIFKLRRAKQLSESEDSKKVQPIK
jgi:hypothetical protein